MAAKTGKISWWRNASLRRQMILLVCLVTLLPFVIGQAASNRQLSRAVSRNTQDQALLALEELAVTLDTTLAAYDDLLYQIYADAEFSRLLNNLADDPANAQLITEMQMRLRALTFAKEGLQAVTVIYENGARFFYDRLTASTRASSWLGDWDTAELYRKATANVRTCYLPADFGVNSANEQVPLFHMAHASFNYRQIMEHRAIIVMSLDESVLSALINPENPRDSHLLRLIVDADGNVLSAPDKTLLGQPLPEGDAAAAAREWGLMTGKRLSAASVLSPRTGWTVYQVQDLDPLENSLLRQRVLMLLFVAVCAAALVAVIVLMIRRLTRSFLEITRVMKQAGAGDLSARVAIDRPMPEESAVIAGEFNAAMDRMNALMDEVKEGAERQRNAEIAAMEAQLNPHFLYNTLDTINWMAIDSGQYDISNAIASLARILRYGIDRSEPIVTVQREVEWINLYLRLTQTRLKNTLEFHLQVDEETLQLPIRKLLFQPFVENAVIHAFAGVDRTPVLDIRIAREETSLLIVIRDNGRGMTEEQVRTLFTPAADGDKHHLGVALALERLRLYYGDAATVAVTSRVDEGTTIELHLPIEKEAHS